MPPVVSFRPLPLRNSYSRSCICGPNEWADLALGARRDRRSGEKEQICRFHLFTQSGLDEWMSGWGDEWVGGFKNSAILKFFYGRQLKRLCLEAQASVCDGAGGKGNRPASSGITARAGCSASAKRPPGAEPVEPGNRLQTCSETSSSLEQDTYAPRVVRRFLPLSFFH